VRRNAWVRVPALLWALGMSVWAMGATPVEGAGQVPSAERAALLDAVESALRQADFNGARALLRSWQEGGARGAAHVDRERGLWLEARLEVDPERAEPLYRRIVLEYPGGRWSDQSLHHLALLAEGRGDGASRDRWLQALVRDYPASPLREGARRRLESVAPPAVPAAAPTNPATPFTLQVGAFSDRSRAQALEATLRGRGVEARVARIEGSELYRVRIGFFPSREAAQQALLELERRGALDPGTMVRDDAGQERAPS
jgi:hypothetical protein